MKILSKTLLLLILSFNCLAQNIVDTHAIIQPCVTTWEENCIAKLSTQDIITITSMLLLSYQVVQASVIMTQARLAIQTELLNIVTLSINDTFDVRMQAQNNDMTNIKNAVATIEESQEKIKSACTSLKSFGPLLVNIDPMTVQVFISNLKSVILTWARTQQEAVSNLDNIKEELITTIDIYSEAHKIFDAIISADQIEHSQLLEGANGLTTLYKNTENIFANITIIRQESMMNFNNLITLYFKYHYEVLYNYIQSNDVIESQLISIQNHELPNPEQVFTLG